MTNVQIDFHIANHPHLGYRKEDHIDLEHASVTDIQQGAFMGNAILRMPGADFSTVDGWRGLIEWCLRLDSLVRELESGAPTTTMSEPDSDAYLKFRRQGPRLEVTSTRVGGTGVVVVEEFLDEVNRFLGRTIAWIETEHPTALLNLSASNIWARLERYR